LVGRPNVGKSTLFNKIVGRRLSIVSSVSGVTRDRVCASCSWNNLSFLLVDTGGLELVNSKTEILNEVFKQTKIAIETADVLVFVVDITSGMLNQDKEIAKVLIKSKKPIIVCVNKCDSIGKVASDFYEFYNLGIPKLISTSSIHGHGTGDLLDEILKFFNNSKFSEKEAVKVAVIGKPNVGKSSLINNILKEERCIVSDVTGTTRDSVDVEVCRGDQKFCFIDTAGLRKKSKISEDIEKYSIIRAESAIKRSDVCLIIIDSTIGITQQDSKIAALANDAGKGCVIVANKTDDKCGKEYLSKSFKNDFIKRLSFLSWAETVSISAKTGYKVETLFSYINDAFKANSLRISTGVINSFLSDVTLRVEPPSSKGRRLKIFYLTQVSINPPTFVFFVNSKKLFRSSYQRYIENRLRLVFNLRSTPIRFIIREKKSKCFLGIHKSYKLTHNVNFNSQ
jgi:GTP-binding protein